LAEQIIKRLRHQGGLPPGVGPAGAVDLATGAINRGLGALAASGGAPTDLAGTVSTSAFTAAEYASGIGLAKFLWDAGTFMGAMALCGIGVAH